MLLADYPVMKQLLHIALFIPFGLWAQGTLRTTYHDQAKQNVKEIYQVRDTVSNVLHGRYISYFLNGNVESKGQFKNNETTGVWEFYYETGHLKMRGILRQNSNYGLWEYFYEGGQKSMEGTINGKLKEGEWKVYFESGAVKEVGSYVANKREGIWKTFFEDGTLRGEIEYKDDHGRYVEYYHSGKVLAEGPKAGARNVGLWRYYAEEDGSLQSEGEYVNGKKNGQWKIYYPSGKVSASGSYVNDEMTGPWTYYYEDGAVSSSGEYVGGKRNGYWSTLNIDGSKSSEITYHEGSGEFREYYSNGNLKSKGPMVDGKKHGKWLFYFDDGKLEGECQFTEGKGTYYGYYKNGSLQTKGVIENDLRVGTWELYEEDGKLSGYYKPVYDDKALISSINSLVNKSKASPATPMVIKRRRGFYYFQPRYPEYKGVIIQGNPAMAFIGVMPFAIEFYNEERLGHEFGFLGIRNPFFVADGDVAQGEIFERGYAFYIRQKLYNSMKTGMWYIAHEFAFANQGHYANVALPSVMLANNLFTASSSEQRAEYGILLGARLMQKNNGDGFTIDAFVGYGFGYRSFDVEPVYEEFFSTVNDKKFSQTPRFGLNLGYSFSFDGRR